MLFYTAEGDANGYKINGSGAATLTRKCMPELYLTPSAISYLTQLVLLTVITIYLAGRAILQRKKPAGGQQAAVHRERFLLAFFVSFTLLCLLFFLENARLSYEKLLPFALENTVVAILLAALIQFAYHFPAPEDKQKIERRVVFFITCAYILWELDFFVQQLLVLSKGVTVYRLDSMQTAMIAEFAWVVLVFARQAFRHWNLPAVRNFMLILLIPLGVAILADYPAAGSIYPFVSAIGINFTIFLFVLNYLSSQPEHTSFVVKISGAVLTSLLAVFGAIPWLITPAYAERYTSPSIPALDHRTIHFAPDGAGGYVAGEIPFRWEAELGERVGWVGGDKKLQFTPEEGLAYDLPKGYDFDFPFLGQHYQRIFISRFGCIGMGELFRDADNSNQLTGRPLLFPLMVDLKGSTDAGGGVFFRRAPGKAIVTWHKLVQGGDSETEGNTYTFQAVLFADGSFDFTYNGLPESKSMGAGWAFRVIGLKPAKAPPATADFTRLPVQIGPQGALQGEERRYRLYLHRFLWPVAAALIASSLAILGGSALALNFGLARPLKVLLEGVQHFNAGQRDRRIPIQSNDEIGFLTKSFNDLGGELHSLIQGLEARIAGRTQELVEANTHLRSEMEARAAAQGQVIEQQRALAALEEREQLARQLHDGMGQVLGFINVQAQSAEGAVRAGDQQSAAQLLGRVVEVAQAAHDDVRGYILGLKNIGLEKGTPTRLQASFITLLEGYCQHLRQSFGFETWLTYPADFPTLLASSAVETQLMYVIREALSNARSHSGQERAEVTLSWDETQVQAVIEDHGRGFAPASRPEGRQSGHFGLEIMRERAGQVGGSLVVESAPGCGVRLTVCLPRQLQNAARSGPRVLLVDDHPLFLEGMLNLVTGSGMQVVGTASDGLEAQEQARALRPEVILMDIEMPRCNGLEATRRIKSEFPAVKVIMLTVSGEERHLFDALQSGASGYLLKSLSAAELTRLLDELLRGEVSLSPALAANMLEAFTRHNSPLAQPPAIHSPRDPKPVAGAEAAPAELTGRQKEILRLVAQGLMYKQVAAQLGLSEVTIKYHMGEILERLHLNSRREAIQYFKSGQMK